MTDKTIFSNDSEVAVFSIIFNHPDMVHELNGLKSFMFQSNIHQALFLEIETAVENQQPVDMVLLIAQLEAEGNIAKVGNKEYLMQIYDKKFNKETLRQYRDLIVQSYKVRHLVSAGAEASNLNEITIDNIDDKISKFKKSLDNLQEVRGGVQTVHIGDTVKDVYEDIVARAESPGKFSGTTWGVNELDVATGGKSSGDLWVIGGRPGMAKTALIINSIMADAKAGVASLLFEREMRTPQVVERMIAIETGISLNNIRLGILNKKDVAAIKEKLAVIKGYPIYIDTSYRMSDTYYIESTVNKYKNLYDVRNVYLDYIGLLVERDENQTNEIGKYSRLFKSLSNELGICSIIVSQLNRGVEIRDNKRPVMSDLRQSGNLEEDADFVVGLYRDEYYNPESKAKGLLEFIILKHRNGQPGTKTVRFENPTNKIMEL